MILTMPDNSQLAEFANLILTWVGYGTVIGLTAKAIMPGKDPGGAIATLLMGIVGTLIGVAVLKLLYPSQLISPISVKGFAVGTAGALLLLTFYKVLGGYWFVEGGGLRTIRRRRRRRRYDTAFIDD